MANEIYQGEKLAFVGELKSGQTVTTDFRLVCQVYCLGQLVMEFPCSIDTASSKYYGVIDTAELIGKISIRFVAVSGSGDKTVMNGYIQKTIMQ